MATPARKIAYSPAGNSARFITRRPFYKGGIALNPTHINNCQLWLDAADIRTIIKNGSNLVSQWNDKSGNANHATATGTLRPTWTDNQLNSKAVLDFNGSNVLVLPSSIYSLANGANTIFAVCKTDDDSSLQLIFGLAEAGITRLDLRYKATAGEIYYQSRNNQTLGVTKTGVTDTTYGVVMGRRSGTTQAIAYDGSFEATNTSGVDEPDIDAASIGAFNETTTFALNGQIAEIIAFNASLSTLNITNILNYFTTKWGV